MVRDYEERPLGVQDIALGVMLGLFATALVVAVVGGVVALVAFRWAVGG